MKLDLANIGRPKNAIQLDPSIEEDLIAKCQRLEMENEYLKKLSTLVYAIASFAFSNCELLSSISIPGLVKK